MLLLELCFVVFGLGIVTIVPSACALQRGLTRLRTGEAVGIKTFALDFARFWPRAWLLGLAVPAIAIGLSVSIPFWAATAAPVSWVGTGLLVFLTGLVIGIYLSLLWRASIGVPSALRTWLRDAAMHLAAYPLRALWATFIYVAVLVAMVRFPAAALLLAGLGPALITGFMLGGPQDHEP
jgi:hypothetical protein